MTRNFKKFTAEEKKLTVFYGKLQFTYSLVSIKDVQVSEEAFSPQKKTSCTSNLKFLTFLVFLWVIFALLDPDLGVLN